MPGYDLTDTIVAPATPLAASAIGIVRLSGPRSWEIARGIVNGLPGEFEPQRAYVERIEVGEQTQDTCVAIFWKAPHSYTGEDISELMLHGSPVLMQHVLTRCQAAGARLAEPGEFTYRAYLSGKLDLSQAEAVQELISAPTAKSLELAAAQLAGLPGRRINAWIHELRELLAGIEVIHDYAADDLDASIDPETLLTTQKLSKQLAALIEEMDGVLAATRRTQRLREGITVAICGPPNVGKSTLFNALLGHERALTAPEPGTTRDYLSETLETAGVRLTLVDTAGYREAADAVEAAGVARAAQWARGADRVLWVTAADEPQSPEPDLPEAQYLRVATRCDLLSAWPESSDDDSPHRLHVSGITGRGIPELWRALVMESAEHGESAFDSLGKRQAQGVQAARDALLSAIESLRAGMPMDGAAVDIYTALEHLHGTFEQADRGAVIEQIFSGFCVGK